MGAIQDVMKSFFVDSENMIRSNMTAAGVNASGKTAESIRTVTLSPFHIILEAPGYVYVLEKGRGPGKRPPKNSIIEWLQTKPVSIEKTLDSAYWAISTVIAQKGTKLFQEGGRKDIITPVLDKERFNALQKTLADMTLKETVDQLDIRFFGFRLLGK